MATVDTATAVDISRITIERIDEGWACGTLHHRAVESSGLLLREVTYRDDGQVVVRFTVGEKHQRNEDLERIKVDLYVLLMLILPAYLAPLE